MAKRLYVVTQKRIPTPAHGHELKDADPRIIRATTPAGALRFATADFYTVDKATPESIAALVGDGVKIEEAIEE